MSLHLVLLLGLLGVTSLLLLVTVTNRLRLRRVLVSWRSGRLFGLPAGPTIFIALILAGIVAAVTAGRLMSITLLVGYLTGGTFWFAGALIARTTLVTDHGLILSVNRADRTIAWGQVVDYFEFSAGRNRGYVFFYMDDGGVRRRLELTVPAACQKQFQGIVASKLDSRFEFTVQQAYGKTAMEG